jgi:hypothetical protein
MTRVKRPLSAIQWVVIHHTASNDKYSTHETLDEHLKVTNLGYHVTVDDDLALTIKGAGADSKFTFKQHVPDDEVVWGAAGGNYHGWHISIDGNSLLKPPTEDEKFAVVQIVAQKVKRWGWKKKDVWRIVTHNYIGIHVSKPPYSTECPGLPTIEWMPELRKRVANYLPD